MPKTIGLIFTFLIIAASANSQDKCEAVSLLGKKLFSQQPGQAEIALCQEAGVNFQRDPSEENCIWYGRRLGNEPEARKVLERINERMTIIENQAYYDLLLMYKGIKTPVSLLAPGESTADAGLDRISQGYGVGNWYFYNGDKKKATEIFEKLMLEKNWAAFGFIAAEADLAQDFGKTANATAQEQDPFQGRRKAVMQKIAPSIAFIPSRQIVNDREQDSNFFYYLTGMSETNATLVLAPEYPEGSFLFIEDEKKDSKIEYPADLKVYPGERLANYFQQLLIKHKMFYIPFSSLELAVKKNACRLLVYGIGADIQPAADSRRDAQHQICG